jgi:hypothetical protein
MPKDRADRVADPWKGAAAAALLDQDWRGSYEAAKWWVSQGGGAWTPAAWLVYAASGVLHGQPRIAVRSVDLALGNWIEATPDRSILHWARAVIVLDHLSDPKTARADFDAASVETPTWLRSQLQQDDARARDAAPHSRRRKPSVDPAPAYEPSHAHDKVSPPHSRHVPGDKPALWHAVLPCLLTDDGAA